MSAAFPLGDHHVLADADGTISVVPKGGPMPRIDGFTIGLHAITGDSPHDGELHDDGDELLVVVSGAITVVLHCDRPAAERITVDVAAGNAVIVPVGVWHRILCDEPTQLLNATPGPHFDVRRLAR